MPGFFRKPAAALHALTHRLGLNRRSLSMERQGSILVFIETCPDCGARREWDRMLDPDAPIVDPAGNPQGARPVPDAPAD